MASILVSCQRQLRHTLVCGILLLPLLLALPQSAYNAERKCDYNAAHTFANCSFRDLDFVPWGLHKNIIKLDLSGNHFPTLANQSFISYLYIRHLNLNNNSISTIETRAFQTLSYLNTLDLSNNKLRAVPVEALQPIARSLLTLLLAGNTINSIPRGVFKNLINLKTLDLSGNMVFKVDYGAFQGLRAMQFLKLRHNALSYLPPESFEDFPKNLIQVQLWDNRWFCDCRMRWLWQWLNNTNQSVWDTQGYFIRCEGPSIVRDKPLNSLPLDELACEVQMKTSSSTRELVNGANITLLCKYASVPEAEAKWLRNSEIIEVSKNAEKYSVESWTNEGHKGERTQLSELKIQNFRYEDIAKYECFVQNLRGVGSTEYRLTLEGVAFDSVTSSLPEGQVASSGVDTRSVVIAVAVVCGIILLIVIAVLIFCSVNRVQRMKQKKHDAIVENVKKHFINSEAAVSNGDIAGLNTTSKSLEDKLDGTGHEDDRSTSNNTNDSNATAVKRPLDLEEGEPLYTFEQPESPFNNGNTYVSFGSELTDPGEFQAVPSTQYPPRGMSNPRYESSHAGSATPLLDRYTPSVFDSDEPVEDYAHYPVYDSLTNSIQHPYGEGLYGTAPYRNGSTSGYSSYRSSDAAKRLSSFNYPPSANGSMPMTPGSTRSTLALGPRYTDYASDGSPRPELARPMPIPASDYRDYRDMQYPATTPPPHRMTAATKKSMSVGNLGYTPLSTGPRKPPRLFQSREYMELTPQESNGDYITSPEAQQYSQSYGITPGTPV